MTNCRVVGDFLTYADYTLMFRNNDPDSAEVRARASHNLACSRERVALYEHWLIKPLLPGANIDLPMSPHLEEPCRVQRVPAV